MAAIMSRGLTSTLCHAASPRSSETALDNLRSSLDHLVYALALRQRGRLSDEEATETAFPIFNTCAGFNARGKGRIRHVGPGAQAIIDGLQPYHAGHDATSQALWLLEKLRTSTSTAPCCSRSTRSVEPGSDNPSGAHLSYLKFTIVDSTKPDAEFARYRFLSVEDGTRVKVKVFPFIQVTFEIPPHRGVRSSRRSKTSETLSSTKRSGSSVPCFESIVECKRICLSRQVRDNCLSGRNGRVTCNRRDNGNFSLIEQAWR